MNKQLLVKQAKLIGMHPIFARPGTDTATLKCNDSLYNYHTGMWFDNYEYDYQATWDHVSHITLSEAVRAWLNR